jgi:hypothetical protein
MNKKNNKIKTINAAGKTNILFGICTTLIYLITILNNAKVLDMQGLLSNELFKNMYMIFQLSIVITGVISIVYGLKLMRIHNSLLFHAAYFLAGINCMLLMFMGVVLVFAPLNIVAGVKMLGLFKKDVDINEDDDEFGGRSSALGDNNVSTAVVLDSIINNTENKDEQNSDDAENEVCEDVETEYTEENEGN